LIDALDAGCDTAKSRKPVVGGTVLGSPSMIVCTTNRDFAIVKSIDCGGACVLGVGWTQDARARMSRAQIVVRGRIDPRPLPALLRELEVI